MAPKSRVRCGRGRLVARTQFAGEGQISQGLSDRDVQEERNSYPQSEHHKPRLLQRNTLNKKVRANAILFCARAKCAVKVLEEPEEVSPLDNDKLTLVFFEPFRLSGLIELKFISEASWGRRAHTSLHNEMPAWAASLTGPHAALLSILFDLLTWSQLELTTLCPIPLKQRILRRRLVTRWWNTWR